MSVLCIGSFNIFAENEFDPNNIICGQTQISNGINKNEVKNKCGKYKYSGNSVIFFDDNSKKSTSCMIDKSGLLITSSCHTVINGTYTM